MNRAYALPLISSQLTKYRKKIVISLCANYVKILHLVDEIRPRISILTTKTLSFKIGSISLMDLVLHEFLGNIKAGL